MVLMRFYSGIVMDSPTDCVCFLFFTYHYLFDHYVYILLLFVSIIITTIIVIITIIIVTIIFIIIIYCLIFEEPSTRFEKKELIASFSGRYCSIFFGASIVIL